MKFTILICNFQGVSGYMFKQWLDGVCVCSQFIPKQNLTEFCKVAGIDKTKIEIEK